MSRLPDSDLTVMVDRAAEAVWDKQAGAGSFSELPVMGAGLCQNDIREQVLPVVFHASQALHDLGYRKPRIITTHAEVVRLTRGSVLYDNSEITWLLMPDGEGGQFWLMAGDAEEYTGMDIELPATVLREPTA